MTDQEIRELYKKVQKNVKSAEKKLIAEHKRNFPHHPLNKTRPTDIGCEYQQNLHIMYLNLTKKKT